MKLIKIEQNENGSHNNQTINGTMEVPEGYAVIPEDMVIPDTFPFVSITTEEIDGVQTVATMTAGTMPEPKPQPEPEPTIEEKYSELAEKYELMAEVLDSVLMDTL